MALAPIVRYMILCEDCRIDADNEKRIDIFGLLSNINSQEEPPFPVVHEELCVLLALAEMRGQGSIQIACVHEESGDLVFHTQVFPVFFGSDPLDVAAIPIRIRGCPFPDSGYYLVQFWYNEMLIEERPLRLR